MPFRWNDWNLDHATKHGVSPEEAETVVEAASAPYPEQIGDGKIRVIGRGIGGRLVQVIYVVDVDETLYIIHARPLTELEKRRYRRRTR
jgi:uncharacterized DUF497 family protein